ncbi:MAG: HAD-IA family hydrolase [Chlamydiales bacterium]
MGKPVVKAIIFDHDDTLVGTIGAKWSQHKYIAKTFYQKTLLDEEIRLHWGKPLTVLIKSLYETDNIDMAMSYNLATRSQFPKLLFKDTISTLKKIRKMGKKMGLVTATTTSSLDNDFKTLNISKKLFDYIQTEDDTSFHKPDKRVFAPALQWIASEQITPKEVIYVGDSLNDMEAAIGAGFQFIGVSTGLVSVEEFAQRNVKALKKLSDLESLIYTAATPKV